MSIGCAIAFSLFIVRPSVCIGKISIYLHYGVLDHKNQVFYVREAPNNKKRKNWGQLTQMWVDGVRWSQTIVHHLSYGIFDPFFPPENAIFVFFLRTVKTVDMVDMVDIWLKLSA